MKKNHEHRQQGTEGKAAPAKDRRARVALRYAMAGLAVLPLHGVTNGRCSCGDDQCDRPGKHPRPKRGIAAATTDPEEIKRLWTKWPHAKIGMVLGGPTKLAALVANGEAGRQSLQAIKETRGSLPSTVTIQDCDRRIRLFRVVANQPRRRDIANGVRILGDGALVVAPSTLNESTNNRRFVPGRALGEIEIAQVPRWLIRLDAAASGVVTGNLAHTATGVTRLPAEPQASRTIVMVPTSEIAPARINWIWPGIIASGSVTGLVGYPGLGKSQVAIDIAATVSTGRQWPGDAANGNAGDVIILSAEDDVAHTIVPRLIAAGANRDRVHAVKAVKEDDRVERAFNLALDLDQLDKDNDIGPVKLLVIDPVSAYLTPTKGRRVDRNNAGDARAILGRLATFAARHGLGVLAISHLNKSNGARAITRTTGSLEWVAAPRAVYLVTEEARTERRLFLPLKNNLAPDRTGYAFEIENRVVADGIRTSAVVWSSDPVTISADEALAAAAKKVTFGAVDFLQQALSEGPMDQTEIVRRGREAGFSEKNLRTAREKLGVTPRKEGFGAGGRWVWVPAGGASVLRLAVNNGANGHTAGAADKTAPDANARDQGTVPERGNAGNDAEKPTEGDLT